MAITEEEALATLAEALLHEHLDPAVGAGLYHGMSGIALALAAYATVTGDSRYERRARETLEAALAAVPALHRRAGGCVGPVSVAYALSIVARLFGDRSLALQAAALARTYATDDVFAESVTSDVIVGLAGTLLQLLAIDDVPVDRAIACGDEILRRRVSSEMFVGAWLSYDARAHCGMASGQAGIALALAHLSERTKDSRYARAATEAMVYERLHFDDSRGNWPDLRAKFDGRAAEYRTMWCHGACGIGLARAALPPVFRDARVDEEIDAAVTTTRAHFDDVTDHVCCGTTGRWETLVAVSESDAKPYAERVLQRAIAGGLRFNVEPAMRNGFFFGRAGLLYQLLRMRGAALPPVLLLAR